jgi:hypothetical protein
MLQDSEENISSNSSRSVSFSRDLTSVFHSSQDSSVQSRTLSPTAPEGTPGCSGSGATVSTREAPSSVHMYKRATIVHQPNLCCAGLPNVFPGGCSFHLMFIVISVDELGKEAAEHGCGVSDEW